MRHIIFILFNVLLLPTFSNAQQPNVPIKNIEIPKHGANETLIKHTAYTLLFNENYKQALWVAYELSAAETQKAVERSNKFLPDPLIKTNTSFNADYAKSGYDKGHLAPAADMSYSEVTMKESFFYSNMSPQLPGFNRGIWKKLEEQVRTWAVENKAVYIVTGPVLTEGLQTIGDDKISVPKYYYKVILDYTEPDIKGIGLILPNESSVKPLEKYAVTIDSVEKFTGIDFFPLLPANQEKIIESKVCISCWSWKSVKNTDGGEVKTSTKKNYTATENKTKDKVIGKTAAGAPIYEGPRGGRYHFSKSGNKVYEKK